MKLRVIHTRDLEVELCEPGEKIRDGDQIAQCPDCQRVAVRNTGVLGGPYIECVCGARFNANHQWIGNADVL